MKNPTENRARRFGSSGFLGVALLTLAVAAQFAIASRNPPAGVEPSAEFALESVARNVVAAAIAVLLFLGLWRLPSVLRERKLRRMYPTAQVFSTGRCDALTAALGEKTQMAMALTVDSTHINLWESASQSEPTLSIQLTDIESVTCAKIEERARSSNGIVVGVRRKDTTTSYPFIIVGAGLFGAFPLPWSFLESLAAQIMVMAEAASKTSTAD